MMRAKGKPRFRLVLLAGLALGAGLAAKAWHDTTRDPVVHTLGARVPMMPGPANPRRIVLLSDLHVAGPDMPPARLARIVRQVNALRPDLVLFAGDFVSDKRTATRHYTTRESIAPLAGLDPQAIKLAVPGNHDHWRNVRALERELAAVRVESLRNEVANAGGLLVAGLDDNYTDHADLPRLLRQFRAMGRGGVVLAHSPDHFPDLPKGIGLMLAGHTHCGQIGWPWGGAPFYNARDRRHSCGIVRENGNTLVTSAGLGTSVLPLRLFTQPEIWVIDVRPIPATRTAAEPKSGGR